MNNHNSVFGVVVSGRGFEHNTHIELNVFKEGKSTANFEKVDFDSVLSLFSSIA